MYHQQCNAIPSIHFNQNCPTCQILGPGCPKDLLLGLGHNIKQLKIELDDQLASWVFLSPTTPAYNAVNTRICQIASTAVYDLQENTVPRFQCVCISEQIFLLYLEYDDEVDEADQASLLVSAAAVFVKVNQNNYKY